MNLLIRLKTTGTDLDSCETDYDRRRPTARLGMRSACLPPHRAVAYLYVSCLGVAFVSGEPKLHSIQLSLAINGPY